MIEIDINFDFRKDSICGDPDSDSPKLYDIHKHLWSKKLPSEQHLSLETLKIGGKFGRIVLKNNLLENLSSDRMCPHFVGFPIWNSINTRKRKNLRRNIIKGT